MSQRIGTVLAALQERIDPETAEEIDRVYELRFVGFEKRWYLDLTGADHFVVDVPPEAEICRLGLHLEDLEALLDGSTSLKGLVTAGRLRVFGDFADAMRLARLFG